MPHPTKPNLADVMKRHDAKDVLDDKGRAKRRGPHIHPAPMMYVKGVAIPLDSDAEQPAGSADFVVGATPTLVIQAEPSDLGPAQNLWANNLWTTPASSLQVANQGQDADCYHLAAQGQLLDTVPWYLQACVAKVAPNFVDVTYRRNRAAPVTYRTTGMLGNHLRPDAKGSTGCCYVEKTFAMERTGANTYASTSWGSPGTVLGDLGVGSIYLYPAAPSFLTALLAARANNKGLSCLTKGTIAAGVPLIGSHAYVVIDVVVTGPGPLDYVMTLRNVWGFDGIGNDGNTADGLVKLTGAQVLAGVSAVCQATDLAPDVVPPAEPPAKKYNFTDYVLLSNHYNETVTKGTNGDFNGDGTANFADYTILSNNWDSAAGQLPPAPNTETPMNVVLKNDGKVLTQSASIPFVNGLGKCLLTWDADPGVTVTVSGGQFQRPDEVTTVPGNKYETNFTQSCTLKLTFTGAEVKTYTVAFVKDAAPDNADDPIVSIVVTATHRSGKVTNTTIS